METTRGVFVPIFPSFSYMGLRQGNMGWSVGWLFHRFDPGSITIGYIAKKFGAAICVAKRKNFNDFLDPLTFPLVSP